MSEYERSAYEKHSEFLLRGDKKINGKFKIVEISSRNLQYLALMIFNPYQGVCTFNRDLNTAEEGVIQRVKDLNLVLKHSSVNPSLIIEARKILSRSALKRAGVYEIYGAMTKSIDKSFRYEDFVFAHLVITTKWV